jgi:hypothetical protein
MTGRQGSSHFSKIRPLKTRFEPEKRASSVQAHPLWKNDHSVSAYAQGTYSALFEYIATDRASKAAGERPI